MLPSSMSSFAPGPWLFLPHTRILLWSKIAYALLGGTKVERPPACLVLSNSPLIYTPSLIPYDVLFQLLFV